MPANAIIGVVGMRGHGKSTKMRETLHDRPHVLVVDRLAEHGGEGNNPGWTETLKGSISQNINRILSGKWQRVSVLLPVNEEEQQIAFLYYCRAVYACARKLKSDLTLVVEEIDWYSKPNWENEGLKLIIQYGRHGPVNLVWTARNIGSGSRKLTSETDMYVLFRVQEPIWLDAMRERLSTEVAERVSELPEFHFLLTDKSGKILEEGITNP